MYRLCIIGLGNPDAKYQGTRHNIGKDWLIKKSSQFFKEFTSKKKLKSEIGKSHSDEILWSIPKHFMNESGETVLAILKSTNISTDMLIVIHDDLDLNLGDIRIKKGGGHGGHNGLRDIINKIGKDNFIRIRIGIGHPGKKEDVTNWVLNKFSPDEKITLDRVYLQFAEIFELICNDQIDKAQKILHTN